MDEFGLFLLCRALRPSAGFLFASLFNVLNTVTQLQRGVDPCTATVLVRKNTCAYVLITLHKGHVSVFLPKVRSINTQ